MIKHLLILAVFALAACGGPAADEGTATTKTEPAKKEAVDPKENKGIGEVKHVELNDPLDAAMVEKGEGIYQLKCAACHKLTDQRVVGPGWAGVTTKRTPEWIMNMTTNVDVMLDEDPIANELFKECLVRMPNQNMSVEDSRAVLEFMYKNDGKAVAGE